MNETHFRRRRSMRSRKYIFPLAMLTAASMSQPSLAQNPTYSITDLGTLAGSDATTAPGTGGAQINNAGHVTGFSIFSDVDRNIHGFSWADGVLTDLPPTVGTIHSQGLAINNADIVVGISYTLGDVTPTALRWLNNSPQALGNFVARGINDAGLIVGEQPVPPAYAQSVAVRWSGGSLTQLTTLGGSSAGAYGLDSTGRIVGMALVAGDANYHAVLWLNNVIHDLGTLGGARSHAFDINDSGQIVGFADTAAGVPHACILQVNAAGLVTSRTDLGGFDGGFSYGFAINALGEVVGSSDSRAALWDDAGIHDLNLMIPQDGSWELMKATGISDGGLIIGHGKHYGLPRTFLLGPIMVGDFDGDGHVNVIDLFQLLAHWGNCAAPCPPNCSWDITSSSGPPDCVVDVFDLFLLLSNWG
jgi:probable HAF family extracellular repeat protein